VGPWAIWARANGGEVVDDPWSPSKATMDDPKVVAAATFWTDLVVKHKAAPWLTVMEQPGRAAVLRARDRPDGDGRQVDITRLATQLS
jgi:hypothetical protein